jgi:hypothetical protein
VDLLKHSLCDHREPLRAAAQKFCACPLASNLTQHTGMWRLGLCLADEDIEDAAVDQTILKKRNAGGLGAASAAQAHNLKCLKRADSDSEGKRVRLTNEQKAEILIYAAYNVQLSREDVIS